MDKPSFQEFWKGRYVKWGEGLLSFDEQFLCTKHEFMPALDLWNDILTPEDLPLFIADKQLFLHRVEHCKQRSLHLVEYMAKEYLQGGRS